jgi:hypothetical protein
MRWGLVILVPRRERKGVFRKAAVIAGFLSVYVCRMSVAEKWRW